CFRSRAPTVGTLRRVSQHDEPAPTPVVVVCASPRLLVLRGGGDLGNLPPARCRPDSMAGPGDGRHGGRATYVWMAGPRRGWSPGGELHVGRGSVRDLSCCRACRIACTPRP